MQRRNFIALIATAGISLLRAAGAQQSQRMRRVSMLLALDESDSIGKSRVRAFRLGMRDLGWIEGRNVQIDARFVGNNPELITKQVVELIRLAPDIIVANSSPVMAALRPATSTIPIVFVVVNDPVGQGFISNLAHPGVISLGFHSSSPKLLGKWINMLGDVKPDLSKVALMFNPDTAPYYDLYLRPFKALQQRTSVKVEAVHVRSVAEIDSTVAKLGREPGSALIAAADPFIIAARGAIANAAHMHRVPIISPYRQFAAEGSLMSYGPDSDDIFRRSSSYVDRILKGEPPGNLPAQSPIKFELVINLKVAKLLGLTVRESFLLLADEVIE
jgi:putative ABC transport system substrate-binding protein